MGGVLGTIEILLTAAQTATLNLSPYVYDLEIYNGSEVRCLLEGAITITPEVTR
jgi:hypothetical protein